MSVKKTLLTLLLAGLALVQVGPALAASDSDPVISLDSRSKIELDLSVMIQELIPALTNTVATENPEEAQSIQLFLDQLGLDSLQRLRMESKQSKTRSTSKGLITLDPQNKDGLLPRLLTMPNGSCRFSRHLDKDQLVMFTTLHNFSTYLDIFLDFLSQPGMDQFTGELPLDQDGDLVLGDFSPRKDLLPLLSGEMDFFILEQPADAAASASPLQMPYCLVLGSTDGHALRDKLLDLATSLGGDKGGSLADMIRSLEPETLGDFEMVRFPFGGALAVSNDFLVLGLNPDSLGEILATEKGGLKVPDGIEWVYMDGPRYGSLMGTIMDLTTQMAPDDSGNTELISRLYEILFDHLESEEVLYRSRPDGLEIKAEVDGPVVTGAFKMIQFAVQELPDIIARQKDQAGADTYPSDYEEAVTLMEDALSSYADDHDMTYPEHAEDLVGAGYLENFPLGREIPPGTYEDWGYTYFPLHDDSGAVDGYLLFVFGGGEGTGYDVYTPENLAASGDFKISSDGQPDGVVTFTYDGSAVIQMQDWDQ